ncbi:hypothetical protein COOONC_24720 [Cooperia oncophora]
MADLEKLDAIPLSSFFSLRANTDFCRYKYALMVYGNEKLTKILLSKTMDIKREEVFIRANKKLRSEMVTNAPFDVDVGSPHDCTMAMAMKRTDCTALVGDVIYPGDVDLRNAWYRIKKVYGTITVNEIWEYDLGFLKNVTVDGWQREQLHSILSPYKEKTSNY